MFIENEKFDGEIGGKSEEKKTEMLVEIDPNFLQLDKDDLDEIVAFGKIVLNNSQIKRYAVMCFIYHVISQNDKNLFNSIRLLQRAPA